MSGCFNMLFCCRAKDMPEERSHEEGEKTDRKGSEEVFVLLRAEMVSRQHLGCLGFRLPIEDESNHADKAFFSDLISCVRHALRKLLCSVSDTLASLSMSYATIGCYSSIIDGHSMQASSRSMKSNVHA